MARTPHTVCLVPDVSPSSGDSVLPKNTGAVLLVQVIFPRYRGTPDFSQEAFVLPDVVDSSFLSADFIPFNQLPLYLFHYKHSSLPALGLLLYDL